MSKLTFSVFVNGMLCEDFVISFYIHQEEEDFHKYPMPDYTDQIKIRSRLNWLQNQSAIFDRKYSPEFIGMFTTLGYGLTFNMVPSDQLFSEDISEDFMGTDKYRLKPLDGRSDLIEVNQTDYPLKGFRDLRFHFDPHPENVWRYPDMICKPMKFLVHSPYEVPGSYDDNKYCQFYHGNDLEVLITPEIIISDESLRSYPPDIRECYFEDERKLRYFKKYTKKNCQAECFSNYTVQRNYTKCLEFHQIRSRDDVVCDYRYYEKLKGVLKNYEFSSIEDTCNCLDGCSSVKYSIEIISSDLKVNSTHTRYSKVRYKTNHWIKFNLNF
jgi:Amiloride-sensitive sodium channel